MLDRIADEIEKSLQPKAEPKPENTIIIRLRRQAGQERLTPDKGALHVGVLEDMRRDDAIVLSVFGIRSELSISFDPETRVIVGVRSSHFEHNGFVWRLKKVRAELKDVTVEVRSGAADAATDLLDVLLRK